MTSPAKISELLERKIKLLASLEGEQVNGFAVIVPPEGDPIDFVTLGSQADQKSFFEYLANKLKAAMETSQYGGVRVPR